MALPPVPEDPEPFVMRALEALPAPRSTRVLEVGCGAGRHLVWLERQGFSAYGLDRARLALAHACERLTREGRPPRLAVGEASDLPFAAGRFGAVIAFDALSRGTRHAVRRALTEAARVLRDEGVLVGALLSTRAWRGPTAGGVRHYCDEDDARNLLAGLDVDSLALDEFSDEEGRRHSHWRFIATRRAPRGSR